MRLLLLTNEFALPQNTGGVRRQLGLVRALGRHHELHLLARERDAAAPPALVEELRGLIGGPVETFPARPATWDRRPPAVARRLGRAVRRGAPAWTESAISAPLVARARVLATQADAAVCLDDTAHTYATLVPGVGFVLDKHNVLAWSRRPRGGLRPAARLEHRLVSRWEARTIAAARAVVVTSDSEAERLRALYRGDPVVVPSAIDPPARVAAPAAADRCVVWLGDHRYAPNTSGLLRFAEAWAPLGRSGATLLVVGRDPSPATARVLTGLPGVRLLGYVEDLDPILAGARAAVAPVWEGAGIKMKTLTLMGAGLPVAGTPVAFEGIAARDGENALIGADPHGLVAALQRVLDVPQDAARIGASAHATIVADHTWDGVAARYDEALARASTRATSSSSGRQNRRRSARSKRVGPK